LSRLPRPLLVLAPLLGVALLAAACRGLAAPQGWGAPVITPQGIITSLHKGGLELSDAQDPTKIDWQFPAANDKSTNLQGIYSTPQVSSDGSTVVFGAYNGSVYALKISDGSKTWSYDTGASIVGSVALSTTTVYASNSDGKVFALDLTAGKPASGWAHPFQAGERIWSNLVLNSGTLYLTSMDHKVYALDASTGKVQWTNTSSQDAIAATPTLENGRLYVGSFDKHLYAIDAQSGATVWKSQPAGGNWFWAQAVVSGTSVFAANLDGYVYAYSTDDGHQLWRSAQALSNSIRGRPALAAGVLVAADRSGHVFGLDPSNGSVKWGPVDLLSNTLGDLVVDSSGNVLAVTEGGSGGSRLVQIDPQTGGAKDLVKQ